LAAIALPPLSQDQTVILEFESESN